VVISIYSLLPVNMDQPVKADWDYVYELFMGEKIQVLRVRLSAYIDAINENRDILKQRNMIVIWAGILLGIIVIIILLMSLFSM
jgi:hypothetical protein